MRAKIFWVTASKGGSGKTLLTMVIHKAMYSKRIGNPRKTLLLDLNPQNMDLFNIISKSPYESQEVISVGNRVKLNLSLIKVREEGPYVATPTGPIGLSEIVELPVYLVQSLDLENVVVDTNINLSSLANLEPKTVSYIKSFLENAEIAIDPIVFFIWSTGSITRYVIGTESKTMYEVQLLMEGIKRLALAFGSSYEEFSQRNIIVTVNTTLWLYNTITVLRTILSDINRRIQRALERSESAFYTFSRLTKDIVIRASRIVAEAISAVSGLRPKFRLIEVFYLLVLDYILFGKIEDVMRKISIPTIADELKVLVDKLSTEEKVEVPPANLFVVPPSKDVYNTQALIYSVHLLGREDIKRILSDPNADDLPYKTIEDLADSLGNFLRAYMEIRK